MKNLTISYICNLAYIMICMQAFEKSAMSLKRSIWNANQVEIH